LILQEYFLLKDCLGVKMQLSNIMLYYNNYK